MAHRPIHRDDPPFNAFQGFVSGLLAGGVSFVPLVLIRVTEWIGSPTEGRPRDTDLIDWLLDRPPLAAAYVAAAIAVPVAVAARYQPHVAVWVGVGVFLAFPIGVAIWATLWWNSLGGGSGFFG